MRPSIGSPDERNCWENAIVLGKTHMMMAILRKSILWFEFEHMTERIIPQQSTGLY